MIRSMTPAKTRTTDTIAISGRLTELIDHTIIQLRYQKYHKGLATEKILKVKQSGLSTINFQNEITHAKIL